MAEGGRRLWVTVGEAAAVVAVIIAGLNYWDAHHDHAQAARNAADLARTERLASSLVLEATVEDDGRRLALKPAGAGQVIESLSFMFPKAVADRPIALTAAAPAIAVDWAAAGLTKVLEARRARPEGRGTVPLGIVSSYVQDGQTRQESAVYLVGYRWKRRLFGGRDIRLEGLALAARYPPAALQAEVDRRWAGR
jgi:hypothetical protein